MSSINLPNELLMEILSHISIKDLQRMTDLVPEFKRFRNDAYVVLYTHTKDLEYLKSQRTSQNVHYVDLGEKLTPYNTLYDVILVNQQLKRIRKALNGHSSVTLQFLFGCDDSSVYRDMQLYLSLLSHFKGIPHHVEVVKRNMPLTSLTKNYYRNIGLLEYNYSTETQYDSESGIFIVDAQEPLYSMFSSQISKNHVRGSMFFNRCESVYEKYQLLSVSREETDLLDVSVLLVLDPESQPQEEAINDISESFVDRLYGDGPLTERQTEEIESIKEVFSQKNSSKLCEILIPHFGRLITEMDHSQTKQTLHDYLDKIFKMKDFPHDNASFLRFYNHDRKKLKDNGIYPALPLTLYHWLIAKSDAIERISRFRDTFNCFVLGLAPHSDYARDILSKLVDHMLFAFKHSQAVSVPLAAVRINVLHDRPGLSVADKERNSMIRQTTNFQICEIGGCTDIKGFTGVFMG